MGSEPGTWYVGLPMVNIQDVLDCKLRLAALETTVSHLEDMILQLRRSVPRETEASPWPTPADTVDLSVEERLDPDGSW